MTIYNFNSKYVDYVLAIPIYHYYQGYLVDVTKVDLNFGSLEKSMLK